jgi:hypothetical protein
VVVAVGVLVGIGVLVAVGLQASNTTGQEIPVAVGVGVGVFVGVVMGGGGVLLHPIEQPLSSICPEGSVYFSGLLFT